VLDHVTLARSAAPLLLGAVACVAALEVARPWLGAGVATDLLGAAVFALVHALSAFALSEAGRPPARSLALALAQPSRDVPAPLGHAMPLALEAAATELMLYKDVADIMRGQISGAEAETERATLSVLSRLTELGETVRSLMSSLDEAERHAAGTTRTGALAVSEMRVAVKDLHALLAARAAEARASQHARARLAARTGELGATLDEIGAASARARWLAGRVAEEVARAGEGAGAFAAFADEMKALTERSGHAAASLRDGLALLSEAASVAPAVSGGGGEADWGGEAGEGGDPLALAERKAGETQAALDALAREAHAMLASARETGARLDAAVIEAMSGLDFQDIVRQRLDHVGEGLARLGMHAVGLAEALRHGGAVVRVDDALLRPVEGKGDPYVGRIGADPAAAGPSIELS